MRKLRHVMRNPPRMATVFADMADVEFALAPPDTPTGSALGAFDCVSGGAIIHAALYVLSRIPGVVGRSRVIEPDRADLTNLNRYMMLLRSHLDRRTRKAEDFGRICAGTGLAIEPVNERYEQERLHSIKLDAFVLVAWTTSLRVGLSSGPIRNGWGSGPRRTGPPWPRSTKLGSAALNVCIPSTIRAMRQIRPSRLYLFGLVC